MPLPDPHAGEMTVELNRDIFKAYEEALARLKEWTEYVNKLKKIILEELGDAYAGTVDGAKVVSHRPKDQYAISRLRSDYPDLTERFMAWKTEQVFDLESFTQAHPEIVEQYRVRAFVKLEKS
jgi:hypothetical protein